MAEKELLELKRKIKKTRPKFVVKESKFSARVKSRWRFPRGKHSKVRQMHRGRPKLAGAGFRSPQAVRGLHLSGLEPVIVSNLKELAAIKPEQGIIIAKVGNKRKLDILKLALEKKISILNIKNVELIIKKIEEDFSSRKKIKQEKSKEKTKKEAEKEKKAEEKKKKETEEKEGKGELDEKLKTQEEEVKEQKKDIEKTIIKKQ